MILAPTTNSDTNGRIIKATIATYGDTVHSFIQRDGYSGPFMPGFVAAHRTFPGVKKTGLLFIDHCVGNVGWGEMDAWGEFYAKGLRLFAASLVR